MNRRTKRHGHWRLTAGLLVSLLLPPTLLTVMPAPHPSLFEVLLVFWLAWLAAAIGISIQGTGRLTANRAVTDFLITGLGGVVTWITAHLLVAHGGGPIDPALPAVLMAYLLAWWQPAASSR
ncbi:hypothetical protein Sulac_3513 [Sulfobacillus acidophilus DSM 10332]|uniref:Uncharacterized protein n=1 Tax=Sulfobacillus acidophilus (strain ATCC 700253 / DSM 10332 / NAL) TaxID=679936 RepID=G8TUY5_SULAD|nr:hypothetical protein Sulac_3513 [Sulfobacillus acidophilus DSM 10332]